MLQVVWGYCKKENKIEQTNKHKKTLSGKYNQNNQSMPFQVCKYLCAFDIFPIGVPEKKKIH